MPSASAGFAPHKASSQSPPPTWGRREQQQTGKRKSQGRVLRLCARCASVGLATHKALEGPGRVHTLNKGPAVSNSQGVQFSMACFMLHLLLHIMKPHISC